MIILKHFQSEKKRVKRREEIGKEGECARANEGDKEKEEGAQGESASWLPTIRLAMLAVDGVPRIKRSNCRLY